MWLTSQFHSIMLIQNSSAGEPTVNLLSSAITNGSIGAILLVIWFLTVKYLTSNNQKNYDKALEQNQQQFQFALKQNQDQFDKSLAKIENQHRDNLAMNQATIDRLFTIMNKDAEYKEVLTGVLTEMKEAITKHIDDHKR